MDMTRARSYGFETTVSLSAGIAETIAWYRANKGRVDQRYNVFAASDLAAAK
jgi:dTDP-D-glucose 4,6-dehydratase